MKAHSPAFSFYPKDILTDETVVGMTDEEFGVYIRLLCHAWLEGSIPADPVKLARMTGRYPSSFKRVWRAIAPCWTVSENRPDRLTQGRLEQERQKQSAYSHKQSLRGSHGGRPRTTPLESAQHKSRGKAAGKPRDSVENPRESRTKPGKSLPSSSSSSSSSPHITTNVLPPDVGEEGTSIGVVRPTEPVKKSWTREASEDWDARFGLGSCNPSRIGLQLGKIVRAHGWATVRPAWRRYLVERDPTFVAPNDFAGKFKAWLEGSIGADDLEAHNRREAAKAIMRKQAGDEAASGRKGLPAHEGFARVIPPKGEK